MGSNSLVADQVWIGAQIILLGAIAVREILRPNRRNLFAILVPVTLLVLVHGQAWWTLALFETTGATVIVHLYQEIGFEAARRANLLVGLATLGFLVGYTAYRARVPANPGAVRISDLPSRPSYLLIGGWTALLAVALAASLGGVRAAVASPGQSLASGLTLLIVLMSLGKLPLLAKVCAGRRPNAVDVGLFGLVAMATLINSRLLCAFLVLQTAICFNYCWRPVTRRSILVVSGALVCIFLVFGLYRDYTARSQDIYTADVVEYIRDQFASGMVVTWFYQSNIEGFSGLAGLLTYETDYGEIEHDFGVSNLRVATQLIPSALRNDERFPFLALHSALAELHPPSSSVIPAGLEEAYGHWGVPGLVVFGAVLAIATRWLDARMSSVQADRLLLTVLSVHVLMLVRGSFVNTIFFFVCEWALVLTYRVIVRASRENQVMARADGASAMVSGQ